MGARPIRLVLPTCRLADDRLRVSPARPVTRIPWKLHYSMPRSWRSKLTTPGGQPQPLRERAWDAQAVQSL